MDISTSLCGFPRIGANRELKFALESYFKGDTPQEAIESLARDLRATHWRAQEDAKIDLIPSNDFSLYDGVLDQAVLINAVPKRYAQLELSDFDRYFAMARGYQAQGIDIKALPMKKWFNTNYHYISPELSDDMEIGLVGQKPFRDYCEAQDLGIVTKPVLVGPFTFLKLARYTGQKQAVDYVADFVAAYRAIFDGFAEFGAPWVALDEPALVCDLSAADVALFEQIYRELLTGTARPKVLLQTYFGDVRDCYGVICELPFDGVGLDFVEGSQTQQLIAEQGFPRDKTLFAGLVNGKNIWTSHYDKQVATLIGLSDQGIEWVLSTSCSLLHVPYTTAVEEGFPKHTLAYWAFAIEKLHELSALKAILSTPQPRKHPAYLANLALHAANRTTADLHVQYTVSHLTEEDFVRKPARTSRVPLQAAALNLPILPTTTIGSFPQTQAVRTNRALYRQGKRSKSDYDTCNQNMIRDCIRLQEELDLDVLVHGEFERTDMVEFFAESLSGYCRTKFGWVQSYGTRCVKPPVVWGDITRKGPMTVKESVFAQRLTTRPVKGMLTGPVTILNWSFPREDISLQECAYQIALAIRKEVLDLEANAIGIIQIDEAALREKLPLRKSDWHKDYLSWAIPAFRLVHQGVKPTTQIHTHMCYSDFNDIIQEIDNMDADVITFEASRSSLTILQALVDNHFETAVGPGIYDIHSPRIPSQDELEAVIAQLISVLPLDKLWINPDCGLKTRGSIETIDSLTNLVAATKAWRQKLQRR